MFEDSNRVRFERPVDDLGRGWWLEAFYDRLNLTPEGLGDLLTRSVVTEKTMIYRYIDGADHRFELRIEGRSSLDADMWFVERTFGLRGPTFSKDETFVPGKHARVGRGRSLMHDLMDASRLLGVVRITVEAQRIGRYAWLWMGFVPDHGSWRLIQAEALRFIQLKAASLGGRAQAIVSHLLGSGPLAARWLATLDYPVPSGEIYDGFGQPVMVPLGRAFFLERGPDWTGGFTFDPDSVRLAEAYIGELGGSGG
jgi:hypothetical protein